MNAILLIIFLRTINKDCSIYMEKFSLKEVLFEIRITIYLKSIFPEMNWKQVEMSKSERELIVKWEIDKRNCKIYRQEQVYNTLHGNKVH